jgi:hypothetical protein
MHVLAVLLEALHLVGAMCSFIDRVASWLAQALVLVDALVRA